MADGVRRGGRIPGRGFVTMATGHRDYFKLAHTLLLSYRMCTEHPMPFAILCDRENEHTAAFDEVVVLSGTRGNWLDKLALLTEAPFEENIFIDADCIAYGDLNRFWQVFEGADDISSIGRVYPLDSKLGWFTPESVGEYGPKLTYLLDFHGGVYFIRPGAMCDEIQRLAKGFAARYGEFTFKTFQIPADEPVIALAMALCGCKPVEIEIWHYCWFPKAKFQALDFFTRRLSYTWPMFGEMQHEEHGVLLHFSIGKTIYPTYIYEAAKVRYAQRHGKPWGRCRDWLVCRRARIVYKVRRTSRRTKNRLRKMLRR